MAKGVEVTLYDADDNPYASGTDIAVLWFDSDLPPNIGQAVGQSAIATTTAGGVLSLDLDAVTGLGVGGWGFLLCYKYDGTDHRDSPIFASRMQVTSMSGTTPLTPADGFVRNPDWPAQTAMVDGVQKFTGLLAVFDHPSNFVALSATAAYVVNWGDGSGDIDVASGVTAERNIAYGDVSGVVVGTSKAVNVTFTDSGDTVNRTAHGFQNGQRVNFGSITGTTGISAHTTYFVVNRAADTFQVAATFGGTALTLTTDGSGTVYVPEYKVAIVTVTPQAANNLVTLSLQKKHSQTGLQKYATTWLDIALNSASLTSWEVSLSTTITHTFNIEIARLGENAVANFSYMFNSCGSLRSLPALDTSSGTNFTGMFANCSSLRAIPFIDTSNGTNFSSMFSACRALQSVPRIDTSSGTSLASMFASCFGLLSVPSFDTSLNESLSSTFNACYSLRNIPVLDTSLCTQVGAAFQNCLSLQSVPSLDFSALAFTPTAVFSGCASLSSARMNGTKESISYASCRLSAEALNDIYTGLATVTAKTITVTGNYGVTGDDPTIATAKGWTVTG